MEWSMKLNTGSGKTNKTNSELTSAIQNPSVSLCDLVLRLSHRPSQNPSLHPAPLASLVPPWLPSE